MAPKLAANVARMGRNFDDYLGLQLFTGMPILLKQSVSTWIGIRRPNTSTRTTLEFWFGGGGGGIINTLQTFSPWKLQAQEISGHLQVFPALSAGKTL